MDLTHRLRGLASDRVRAALGLGVVLAVGATGTFAAWTDNATLSGTSFTSGTLDVQLNSVDNVASATLSMTNMIPGSSSAEVVVLKNNGNVSLKWSLTGGLAGTNATDFNAAIPNGLKILILDGGSKVGTGNTSTCSGGSSLLTSTSLTSTTSTSLLSGQGPLASTGTKSLCIQITLDSGAPTSLQTKSATATFTFTGTSDLA